MTKMQRVLNDLKMAPVISEEDIVGEHEAVHISEPLYERTNPKTAE